MNSKNKIQFTIIISFLLFFLFGCNNTVKEKPKDQYKEGENVEVKISAEQIKAIGLETDSVSYRNLKSTLKVNGKLELPPQNFAQVSVLMGGIIKDIPVREGQLVSKGQVLVSLENTDFLQLQQEFLENKAHLAFAEAEYNRQKELQKDNINATKTFQQTEADYNTSLGKHKVLGEKLRLFNLNPETLTATSVKSTFSILAPISGNLKSMDVNIGKFVEPNKQLFEIVDNHALHIDLTIYEQDVAKVKVGQNISFSIVNDPHHAHMAKIFSINKAFENGQQAVIAHAEIHGTDDQLLSGMYVDARIETDENKVMCLPSEAIVSNGNDHFIYVEHEPNAYKQVQVTTGTTDMGFTEITPLETITPSSKIVIKGAYYLLSQLTKGEGEHHD
jgi:cobalt-zinc-cadmium efflux system membrane fusion protein